jgi:hypothetical protein
MRRIDGLAITALLALAVPAAAQFAGAPPPAGLPGSTGSGLSPEQFKLRLLEERLLTLGRERNRLDDELRMLRQKYGDGTAAVQDKKEQLVGVAAALAEAEAEFKKEYVAREERLYGPGRVLMKPVAVDLRNATLQQAAEVLTRATEIPITIDPGVAAETRLTVQARGVTLGAVLEAIARQADLKLSPSEGGVQIGSWPMVLVNGSQQIFKGQLAPWSAEWGTLPGRLGAGGWLFPGEAGDLPLLQANPVFVTPGGVVLSGGQLGTGGAPTPQETVPGLSGGSPGPGAPGGLTVGPATSPGAGSMMSPGGYPGMGAPRRTTTPPALTMTSVGERLLAVSETGRGPEGQSGAWITIYRIEGTGLKKIASGFHAVRGVPGMGAPGMMPGAPGLPGSGSPYGGASGLPGGGSPFGGTLGLPGGANPQIAPPTVVSPLPNPPTAFPPPRVPRSIRQPAAGAAPSKPPVVVRPAPAPAAGKPLLRGK